jgi:predicted Zn finger-like uncharacterized protein
MCYGRNMPEAESASPSPQDRERQARELPVGVYACPHCGSEVAVDTDEVGLGKGPFVRCPYCGDEFAVGAATEEDRQAQELRARIEQQREAELSAMRIRQVATIRRATIRARSYLLIGAIACAGVAIQAVIQIVQRLRALHRWDAWAWAYAAWLLLMAVGARFFARRWLALGRELAKPLLDDPATPPDFSTLGSDTERWRQLEDIR